MQGVSDLSWDAMGEKLCTASDDFTLKLWDVGKGECLRTLEGHTSYVFCCCFAPIGNALVRDNVSASSDVAQLLLLANMECSWSATWHSSNVLKLRRFASMLHVDDVAALAV